MNTNETHNSADQPAARGRLVAQRRAAVLPVRTPEAAWEAVTGVIGDTLAAARFGQAEDVRAACGRLRPLARYLLTMHSLETGRLEFGCAQDLRLVFTFAYGGTEPDEDLTVPPVEVLGPLGAGTVPALTFYSSCPLDDPHLGALLDTVNRGGVLEARVVALDAGPGADEPKPGPDGTPAAPPAAKEESHDRHD